MSDGRQVRGLISFVDVEVGGCERALCSFRRIGLANSERLPNIKAIEAGHRLHYNGLVIGDENRPRDLGRVLENR